MKKENFMNLFIGLIGLIIGIYGLVNEEYRLVIGLFAALSIILYVVIENTTEISNLKEQSKRLREKINIYKEIAYLKSELEMLKKNKKGSTSVNTMLSIAKAIVILLAIYFIYLIAKSEIGVP